MDNPNRIFSKNAHPDNIRASMSVACPRCAAVPGDSCRGVPRLHIARFDAFLKIGTMSMEDFVHELLASLDRHVFIRRGPRLASEMASHPESGKSGDGERGPGSAP